MIVEKVLNYPFKEAIVDYTDRDVILYALGINLGRDPMNREDLRYLYEDGLVTLPSFAMVLGHPGFWQKDPELEIDWVKILHAEQFLTIRRPLPAKGRIKVSFRVSGIVDKGADKGSILYYEKVLSDPESGEEIARVTTGAFCRGDGGYGSHGETPRAFEPLPERPADLSVSLETDPRSAIIYRLSGDRNPIHVSPDVAAKAGYDRPILHGLCTMGIAGHVLLERLADGDPRRFLGYSCRFSRPVFPGDKLRVDIWTGERSARYRVVAEGRDQVVLDRGTAEFAV